MNWLVKHMLINNKDRMQEVINKSGYYSECKVRANELKKTFILI